jgi:hypothetical protein
MKRTTDNSSQRIEPDNSRIEVRRQSESPVDAHNRWFVLLFECIALTVISESDHKWELFGMLKEAESPVKVITAARESNQITLE